ncbi:MAG: leucine-rich repeat protein, partial [Clostridium sp.]|nr:leucine-rich repeat protein [Clostridium sp.]
MKKIVILVGMAVVLSYTPLTTKIVNAKVNGYVIKDKSNQYSYYNAKQLEDSFLNYKLKSQEGKELYLDFINKKENSIEYVHDDSGKYVKYKDMEDQYNKASNKNDFNLGEQVKEGTKAIDLPQEMKKVSVDAGKITNDILYPKDGQTYDGNKGTINNNLYVEDNNIKVSNTTIKGTLFINPGPEGVVNIENLQADKVVLLSGSVHFINVVSERLEITSESQVRVTSEGNSNIDKTIVSSSTILENSSGTFGTVEVKQTDTLKRIEFRGKFESPVEVNGKADIVAASNSLINQIKVAPKFSTDAVNIQGQGIRLVEVLAKADITFGEGTKTNVIIQDSNTKIEVKANAEIVVDDKTNSASISGEGTNKKENLDSLKKTVEADIKKSEEASNTSPVVVEPGNGGSGSSVDHSIAVSGISITGAGNATTVVNGETLQMSAAVTPTNATNKAVTWSVINITGTATIDANGLITATGVGTVNVKATNAASGVVGQLVVTVEPTLAAGKATAKGELASALLTYTEGNYSAGNWTALTTAKTDGDTAIDAATDLAGVASAKTTALNAMDAVKTIAETIAEAEATAVSAINNADAAGMGAAITTNAAVLGLDLTDYNELSDNSSVITAMVELDGATKATIVSTFNTAVANEKAAEALVAAAKEAIEGATYTNLEVTDISNQAQKTAAVQGVVDGVKGTTTATVSWNAGTSKYDVAISLNEANATTNISTATFVLNDAGKVVAAKAAIEGANYSNLEVTNISNQAEKTAAVQGVVDGVKGTTTATVSWNAVTSKYDVAISLNAANATTRITTATFVQSDAGKVAAAKAAIEGATYTNLEVTDISNQAEKTAAVQGVVNGVKGTTTATVSWNAGTSKYDVAISLNEVNTTTSISTAIFVSSDEYYKYELNETNVTIIEYLKSDKIVNIPEKIKGITVTRIGNGVFMNKGITSVTIPNSITSIGTSAFNGNSLTSLIIPSNVSIESYAFISNSLTSITIGSNVTIGEGFLSGGQNNFRDAYKAGGAGTYTGTQSGTWTKVAAPSTPTSVPTITGTVRAGNFVSVSGTAETGASVVLSINGTPQTAVTATGGDWIVGGLTLSQGDTISVTAILAPKTISAAATTTVVAPANFATFTSANLDYNYTYPCLILNNLDSIEPGSTFDIKKLTYNDGVNNYTLAGEYGSSGDPSGGIQGNYYYDATDKKLIISLT